MLSVLCVLSSLLVGAMGYAEGPPTVQYPQVCRDMFPTGHNATAETTAAPFDVRLTCPCYVPDMYIYVNYKVHDGIDPLEGIFIQARSTSGDIKTNPAVGSFRVDPDKALMTLKCNGKEDSAAAHNAEVKERNKGSWWKAPSDLAAGTKVKFVATALLHLKEFWTFVESAEVGPCPGGTIPDHCLKPLVTTCSGTVVLHQVGLLTVMAALAVLLTRVVRF